MALLFLLAGIFAAHVGAQTNSIWKGGTGNWSNASDWTAGVPNGNFNALISNGGPVSTVNLDINATIANLGLDTGNTLNILSGDTLTFAGTASNATGGGTINLFSGGGMVVGSGNNLTVSPLVNIAGGSISGAMGGTESISLNSLMGYGTISNLQVTSLNSVVASGGTLTINTNSGGFTAGNLLQVNTGSTLNITGGPFNNYNPTTGVLNISDGGGNSVLLQGTLQFDNANITELGAGTHVELDGPGAQIVNQFGQNGLANLNNLFTGARLTLADGATLALNGNLTADAFNSILVSSGSTLGMAGSLYLSTVIHGLEVDNATVNVGGNVTSISGDAGSDITLTNGGTLNVHGSFTNTGFAFPVLLSASSGSVINIGGDLNNMGSFIYPSSPVYATDMLTGGSALNVGGNMNNSGNTLVSISGGSTLNVSRNLNLTPATGQPQPSLNISGYSSATVGGSLNSVGTITVDDTSTLTTRGGFNQTAGSTLMNGVLNADCAGVNVQGGTFSGIGTVNGNVLMAGTMMPGNPTGTMTINGNYTQTSTGTLAEQVGWINGMNGGTLKVNGTANLGGALVLSLLSGFQPTIGETFTLMTFASDTGSFSELILPNLGNGEELTLVFQPTDILAEVEPVPVGVATPEPGTLVLLLMGFLAGLAVFGRRTVRAFCA